MEVVNLVRDVGTDGEDGASNFGRLNVRAVKI